MIETIPLQLSVLHVDDNERFLDLFAYTYKKAFNVISASSVQEALEILKKEPIDVIITDYEMTDMDGLDFLRLVKNEFPDIPVIFYTGQGNEEVARDAFLSGAFDYHVKELGGFAHREKIINSVRRAMEKKSAEVGLRQTQEVYRNVIENIPMILIFYTLDYNGDLIITGANSAVDRTTGKDHLLYLGKPIGTVFPNLIKPELIDRFKQIALFGKPWNFQDTLSLNDKVLGTFEIYAFQTSLRNLALLFVDITELKRIEEQLRQSEEEIRFTMENAPIGIATVNMDGTFRTVNSTFCDILQYPCDELLNKSFTDITFGEDKGTNSDNFHKLLRGEVPFLTFEKRYLRKDGSIVETIVHSGAIRDASEKPLFLVTVIEDNTERKRAEEALRRSEALYRTLVQTSPDAVLLHDLKGSIVMANQQALSLAGFKNLEDVMGKNVFELIVPEDRPRALEVINHLLATGENSRAEYTGLRTDGSRYPVEVIGSIIHSRDGKPDLILTIGRDITERRRTEEALRKSEEMYRTLVETSSDSITIIDRQGNIILANKQTMKLLGLEKPEDYRGKSVFDFVTGEFRPEITQKFNELLATGKSYRTEVAITHSDGSQKYVEVCASAIRDTKGNPERILLISRDITRRRQAEKELEYSEHLYRSLIDTSPEAIVLVNAEGTITVANQQTALLLGFENPEEVIGRCAFDFLIPEDIVRARQYISNIISENRKIRAEFTVHLKNGMPRFVEVSGTVIRSSEGKPELVLAIAWDVSEQKIKKSS